MQRRPRYGVIDMEAGLGTFGTSDRGLKQSYVTGLRQSPVPLLHTSSIACPILDVVASIPYPSSISSHTRACPTLFLIHGYARESPKIIDKLTYR